MVFICRCYADARWLLGVAIGVARLLLLCCYDGC